MKSWQRFKDIKTERCGEINVEIPQRIDLQNT